MRRGHRLVVAAALALGSALSPATAWAAPPETIEGTFVVTAFEIGREPSTGPVGRLWFELTAVTFSDEFGPGSFTERQECRQRGELLHCRGVGTGQGADGASVTIRSQATCTLLLACEGKSVAVGKDGDGRPLVYTSVIVAPGDGTGRFTSRIRTPSSVAA